MHLPAAGLELSQSRRGSTFDYPSPEETAETAVGQQMSQLGIEAARKNLDVPPTIKVGISSLTGPTDCFLPANPVVSYGP